MYLLGHLPVAKYFILYCNHHLDELWLAHSPELVANNATHQAFLFKKKNKNKKKPDWSIFFADIKADN